MKTSKQELFSVLQEFNPWWTDQWTNQASSDLPDWERSSMKPFRQWIANAIPGSALLLGRRLLEQPARLGAAVEISKTFASDQSHRILAVPAPSACYWLSN